MVEIRRFFSVLAVGLLAIIPSRVLADSFSCGTYLIRERMRSVEIVAKCGEPDLVETVSEPVIARRPNGSMVQVGVTTAEYWIYDRGTRKFRVRLFMKADTAIEIELLIRE